MPGRVVGGSVRTAALDAGDGLEWNGTGAVGAAAEGYAGGGQTLVKMQILPGWRP